MLDREFCDRKLTRLQKMMARHNLDALLLAKNENTRYVTGYQRYYCASYIPFVHAALVPIDAGPILLLPKHIIDFGETCYAQEVHEFPNDVNRQLGVLKSLIRRRGLAAGRIGLESDFMHVDYYTALRDALPQARLVSAVKCIKETVAIKFPEEIALLREAARLAEVGIAAMVDAAQPGITEKQLASVGAEAIFDGGADSLNHLCVRTGQNAYQLCPVNTDRKISERDLIHFDTGCIYSGYVSDINRTLVLGAPSREEAVILALVTKLERALITALKPGARASDIFALARLVVADAGYLQDFRIPFAGHGIGISLQEDPYITADSDAIIEPGMVIAMEPGLYVPNRGVCRMEDMVVVTNHEPEFLTHFKDDMVLNGVA
jgi:Xaa-Pro aminopeptidase